MRTRRPWSATTWALAAAFPLAAGAASAWRAAALPTSRRALDGISDRIAATVRDLEAAPATDAGAMDRFASSLAGIETVLTAIARSTPLDARALQLLACVRWERENLSTTGPTEATLRLIDLAATRAPRLPDVLLELAATLFRMNEIERGTALVARVVSEAPSASQRGVKLMLDSGISTGTVASSLPHTPAVVVALKDPMLEAELGEAFLAIAEPQLAQGPPRLLELYGEACLQLGVPDRLAATLDALPTTDDAEGRAERACQRGYALHALGDRPGAVAALERAREASPEDPRYAEVLASMTLESERYPEAERAFRKVLEICSRLTGQTPRRARAYTGLGRSLEGQFRMDEAYDAYRHALALEPEAVAPAERLAHLAAGRRVR
jgi:tetratricopeptide (TPR) repeat protein